MQLNSNFSVAIMWLLGVLNLNFGVLLLLWEAQTKTMFRKEKLSWLDMENTFQGADYFCFIAVSHHTVFLKATAMPLCGTRSSPRPGTRTQNMPRITTPSGVTREQLGKSTMP